MVVKHRGVNAQGTSYWVCPPACRRTGSSRMRYARTRSHADRLVRLYGPGALLKRLVIHAHSKNPVSYHLIVWELSEHNILVRKQTDGTLLH